MTSGFLVLLPPSETKRDGGNSAFGGALTGIARGDSGRNATGGRERDTASGIEPGTEGALSWPALEPVRRDVANDLVALSADTHATAKALKVSEKLAATEATRNRALFDAPRLAAALRYTGVLYDALDAASLAEGDPCAWDWLARHVAVHSALYGLVGATEAIAAYRCSSNSRLPGASLRARWREPISQALAQHDGTILDVRSAGYVALGPAPAHTVTVEVVTDDGKGGVRALNHFNKQAKGDLVRRLALSEHGRSLATHATASDVAHALSRVGVEAQVLDASRLRVVVADPAG